MVAALGPAKGAGGAHERRQILDLATLDRKMKELDVFKNKYMGGENQRNSFVKRHSALALQHDASFVSHRSSIAQQRFSEAL